MSCFEKKDIFFQEVYFDVLYTLCAILNAANTWIFPLCHISAVVWELHLILTGKLERFIPTWATLRMIEEPWPGISAIAFACNRQQRAAAAEHCDYHAKIYPKDENYSFRQLSLTPLHGVGKCLKSSFKSRHFNCDVNLEFLNVIRAKLYSVQGHWLLYDFLSWRQMSDGRVSWSQKMSDKSRFFMQIFSTWVNVSTRKFRRENPQQLFSGVLNIWW